MSEILDLEKLIRQRLLFGDPDNVDGDIDALFAELESEGFIMPNHKVTTGDDGVVTVSVELPAALKNIKRIFTDAQ
jgi:hypothetical protein